MSSHSRLLLTVIKNIFAIEGKENQSIIQYRRLNSPAKCELAERGRDWIEMSEQ